jgi:hypothetical protein
MNYRLFSLLAVLSVIAAALLSCSGVSGPGLGDVSAAHDEAEEPGGPPPLVVNEDAPLLLDESAETKPPAVTTAPAALADNAACFVCHVNYQDESLASRHAAANVGCVICHGDSYAHRNDENNTTPPDVMYPRDRIDAACQQCHASHNVPASKVIALWLKRWPDKIGPETIGCTDCHGDHRLKVRTVRWDKKTGKLL